MPSPDDFRTRDFAGPLTDPDSAAPAFLATHHGGSAARRFNVYRNNVAHSLIDALGQVFPAVRHVAGVERFTHVARLFIAAHPPRSPLLFRYGHGFGELLDGFAPAREQMPWLGDLARLERAWLDAWHAEDASALDAAALGAVPQHDLPALRFAAHPAAMVVAGQWSVLETMQRARAGEACPPPAHAPAAVLVTRPLLSVMTASLAPGEAVLASTLLAGERLDDAAGSGFAEDPAFDFSNALARLLAAGCFRAFSIH